jgi:hypothetical protein
MDHDAVSMGRYGDPYLDIPRIFFPSIRKGGSTSMCEVKNKKSQYDARALRRLLLQARLESAKTQIEQDFVIAMLYLYERGDIDVSHNLASGEIMYQRTESN